jgi:hypothetical protein
MSALLTRRSPVRAREDDCRPRPESDAGPTLDDVVTRAWEVLRAGMPAACPACGGELLPAPGAAPGSAAGRCDSCGTTLS